MSGLTFIADQREVIGRLMKGAFMLLLWERADDHETWCDELVIMADEIAVDICRQPIPKKSVTLIYNVEAIPSFEQVTDAVSLIEHDRFMTRDSRKLIVAGYRAS